MRKNQKGVCLNMTYLNIKSFGVELEGGVDSEESFVRIREHFAHDEHFKMHHDGSVGTHSMYDGLEYTFWATTLDSLMSYADYIYSHDFQVNDSCGLHVHMKFNDERLGYFITSSKDFQMWFMDQYKSHFKNRDKYMRRLANHYCRFEGYDIVTTLDQGLAGYKAGSRYWAININSFKVLRTIEFRILPYQHNVAEMRESLDWLLSTIDRYFNEHPDTVDLITKRL